MSNGKRRLVAANSKWQVFFEHINDGRGNDVRDYLVVEALHKREDKITGICVLPIMNDRFVLIRSDRHALGTAVWETPRGFVDAGETPSDAARRELTEETGLMCAENDLIPLGHYAPEPSTLAARGALFLARDCFGTLRAAEDEIGLAGLQLLKANEMAHYIASGAIEDAGTLICYYKYLAFIGSGAQTLP